MAKKRKKRHQFSKGEFIFNFISLVLVIAVGVYFGYRSLYYYSKQNMKIKEEANTLNGFITSYEVVTDGDGLHHDEEGFYFKGKVENNYVLFANRLFRVIRVNENNTIKIVSEDNVASFMWGNKNNYKDSNLRGWLTKTDNNLSGIYYKTLPSKFISKTTWSEDTLKEKEIKRGEKKEKDFITIPTIYDYTLAGGKESYFNNGKVYYLLGHNEEDANLYIDEDGVLQNIDNIDGYGIRAVLTLKANVEISSGDGTSNNPYVISLKEEKNYINQYVKLGDETWKVFEDNSGLLKMFAVQNVDLLRNYSDRDNYFDINDKDNIAYYLNTAYLNSLSYKDLLIDDYYYTGEISDETDYDFFNVYTNFTVCKVGLLNIFDYNLTGSLDDYFYMNTRAGSSGMQYIGRSNGFLEEADVKDIKRIIPVITVDSKRIVKGSGTIDDPYILE
ncbi:MAG: hypothetical protein IJI22_03440 [Bacilli bacterium]|nr:hypothetical protein [Bacilli bacterium]